MIENKSRGPFVVGSPVEVSLKDGGVLMGRLLCYGDYTPVPTTCMVYIPDRHVAGGPYPIQSVKLAENGQNRGQTALAGNLPASLGLEEIAQIAGQ